VGVGEYAQEATEESNCHACCPSHEASWFIGLWYLITKTCSWAGHADERWRREVRGSVRSGYLVQYTARVTARNSKKYQVQPENLDNPRPQNEKSSHDKRIRSWILGQALVRQKRRCWCRNVVRGPCSATTYQDATWADKPNDRRSHPPPESAEKQGVPGTDPIMAMGRDKMAARSRMTKIP